MAGLRSQAAMPRRRIAMALLSSLQVAVLTAGLLVPAPIISAALQNQRMFEELEEWGSVSIPRPTRQQRTFLLPAYQAEGLAAADVRQRRIVSCARGWLIRPVGHRLPNGLLAPLTC